MKCSRINPKYTNINFWQRFDKKLRETRQADRDAQKPTTTIAKTYKELLTYESIDEDDDNFEGEDD